MESFYDQYLHQYVMVLESDISANVLVFGEHKTDFPDGPTHRQYDNVA